MKRMGKNRKIAVLVLVAAYIAGGVLSLLDTYIMSTMFGGFLLGILFNHYYTLEEPQELSEKSTFSEKPLVLEEVSNDKVIIKPASKKKRRCKKVNIAE